MKFLDIDSCFSREHLFFFEGVLYERLVVNEHNAHEFRFLIEMDDYDYVEDYDLILKLREKADTDGIKAA